MKFCQGKYKKTYIFSLILAFLLFFCSIKNASAGIAIKSTGINVFDSATYNQMVKSVEGDFERWKSDILTKNKEKAQESLWSKLFQATLGKALNTIAYESATWIGSGGNGQKPMFITEGWGAYLTNVGDNAVGNFLETLGKEGPVKFNLCNPNPQLTIKIGLGLRQYVKPSKPACTFTEMSKNWSKALQSKNFLNKFQDMFNPTSNEFGISLSLQTSMLKTLEASTNAKEKDRQETSGWLDLRNIANLRTTYPNYAQMKGTTLLQPNFSNLATWTGSAGIDAANIFINQLAITLLDSMIRKIGGNPTTPGYTGDYGLTDYNAEAENGGATGVKEMLKAIIEPNFTTRGDYNILAELAMCSDPNKAGPTNCVIEDKFSQAIQNKMTVGQALKEGYLNGNGVFGFNSDGLEPKYNEGYPYRSMLILRKFRIIPVGWELAAEYIKNNPDKTDGTKNLNDLVACFSKDDSYQGYWNDWCEGLVDPNWVLKAPLNYCKREGAGPIIISEQVSGEEENSKLNITRDENYCADEQSCIQENSDGTCKLYGYCTEERRKWNFNSQSCEPKYNTCQTFKKSNDQTISYLENTLDYGNCNSGNAGCSGYCQDYDYGSGKFTCTADSGNKIYLGSKAESCDESAEGCHALIRQKQGLGANLLQNSSFEDELAGTIWDGAGTRVDDANDGNKGLQLTSNISKDIIAGPDGYTLAGEAFVLSFYAKNCSLADNFSIGGQTTSTNLSQSADWQRYQTKYIFSSEYDKNTVTIIINSSSCIIDSIKLERNNNATPTNYSDYGVGGLIYEKLVPDGLNCNGSNPPSECAKFAGKCSKDKVGCERYKTVTNGVEVNAIATAKDYCPSECVGYDTYIQSDTVFDSLRDAYFIPTTAKICNADAVGCDQFTNLDEVAQGGEGIEYYSYLRQCIKPSDAECGDFYTWEGSDEAGYQLKVIKLKTNNSGSEPAITEDDSLVCKESIYKLPSTDPNYNSDCRQFYNRSGQVTYHLYTKTISCDSNCHPYRRTTANTDPVRLSQDDCPERSSQHWDNTYGECVFCKNGGVLDSTKQACIYNAIPGQGTTCSADQNGCREYTGNTANNTRYVVNDNFEGELQNWSGLNGTTATLSNVAVVVGGNSMSLSGGDRSAGKTVGKNVEAGKSYVLTFIAKTANMATVGAKLTNSSSESSSFGNVGINSEWMTYKINLINIGHIIDDGEKLIISGSADFYIDEIKLTEITDRYYLIANSWNTPAACDQDLDSNPAPQFMLGCKAYQDREGKTHNLYSFTNSCQQSEVGCELMIDTHNSSSYKSNGYTKDGTQITIPADDFDYIVYDSDKLCAEEEKGCQRLGKSYQYGSSLLFTEMYLKNNPDNYNESLCGADAVGCDAWTTSEGISYFKDPGDQTCVWQQASNSGSGTWGWYKNKVKRCGGNGGEVCLTDNDCPGSTTCQTETQDIACNTEYYKTLGYGGSKISQPVIGWAGICSASESGCTEYIDPISKFNTNLLFNSNFSDIDGNNQPGDGWAAGNSQNNIKVESNTLYRLAGSKGVGNVTLACNQEIYSFDDDNNLVNQGNSFSLDMNNSDITGAVVYLGNSTSCAVSVRYMSGEVELKKVAIDYQLKQNLNKTDCNGSVNFDQGCVLFNERSRNGGSQLADLKWDADLLLNGGVTSSNSNSNPDSNVILKVTPDRVCDKWLSCRSMVSAADSSGSEQNVCFDIGLCNSVDDNGNCNNFITTSKTNQSYPTIVDKNRQSNFSGYSKVFNIMDMNPVSTAIPNYYPMAAMKQIGEIANVPNGNFEISGANKYPTGWYYDNSSNVSWNENIFKVIDNPYETQSESIGNSPEGAGYLKLGSAFNATSEPIDVLPETEYVITAYVNTMNLSAEQSVKINVMQFGDSNNELDSTTVITYTGGNDWKMQLGKFSTDSNITRIKLRLLTSEYGADNASGKAYFDDIKIKPALNSKDNWYTPQSCRLYPKSDSMSCNYYDSSGIRYKGWSGYCLEYDRSPGNSDACLLWWPVDKVKGDGIEESAGYQGKIPVYYCTEAQTLIPVEYRNSKIIITMTEEWFDNWCNCNSCPTGYVACSTDGINCYSSPSDTCLYDCKTNGCDRSGWYKFNGFHGNESSQGLKYYDPLTNKLYDDTFAFCTKVVQAVNSVGDNKYWAGRVFEGSNWKVTPFNYEYSTTDAPFGSITAPSGNPYDWDGNTMDGMQPLAVTTSKNENTAGVSSPYKITGEYANDIGICGISNRLCLSISGADATQNKADCTSGEGACDTSINFSGDPIEKIKLLFAKSYGAWQWNSTNSRYTSDSTVGWSTPINLCPSETRGTTEICAIPPQIPADKIKVNNSTGNIEILNNQFIKFSFITKVDSQQKPLVMYDISWGDDEKTTVSGVEMRDRDNPDNPFLLYHLFSYWDLKTKDNQGKLASSDGNTSLSGDCGNNCRAEGYCSTYEGAYCRIKPKIKIKDNWGWCNNGVNNSPCPNNGHQPFSGWIVVREK